MSMKALVRAYLNENLGDDLFVYILCNRYPNTKFTIIGESKYKKIASNISNLKFICEDSKKAKIINKAYKLFQKINHQKICNHRSVVMYNIFSKFFNVNVFVTGSFFIQNPEWDGMEDSMWYDSKPHILGCNFGPYYDERYLIEHKLQFAKVNEIFFREHYSCELFNDLNNVHYAPDLVFNLDKSKFDITDKGYYVISVVNFNKDNDNSLIVKHRKYIEYLVRWIEKIREDDKEAILMSFCTNQGDDGVINEILEELSDTVGIRTFYYSIEGIEKAVSLISNCRGIIASRYHAMILGFLFNKKVLPICYSKKMNNVLKDIGYSGLIADVREDLYPKLSLNDIKTFDNKELDKVVQLAKHAFRNLDMIFENSLK